ncbi:MAG: radical SAM protein [Lachnospiraceae bacterium]|nr:radical SAM protein [Lachnospiraceae bacterium]
MQVDRFLYPVHALGPGERLVIWFQGCEKHCRNCANPELQKEDPSKNISLSVFEDVLDQISEYGIDGLTLTGGEPLYQAGELLEWIDRARMVTDDILMFTGYSPNEIVLLGETANECIRKCSVVIAGEYIDELNDNHTALLASSNQQILWIDSEKRSLYLEYMNEGRTIENVFSKDTLVSVGIHNRRE